MSGKKELKPEEKVRIVRRCLEEGISTHRAGREVGVGQATILCPMLSANETIIHLFTRPSIRPLKLTRMPIPCSIATEAFSTPAEFSIISFSKLV